MSASTTSASHRLEEAPQTETHASNHHRGHLEFSGNENSKGENFVSAINAGVKPDVAMTPPVAAATETAAAASITVASAALQQQSQHQSSRLFFIDWDDTILPT